MVRTPRELEAALPRLPLRGPFRVRRRLALPGEVAGGQPSRRGPGGRGPLRPRRPPGRARLLRPASPPEDRRGGTDPGPVAGQPRRSLRAGHRGGRCGRLREHRDPGVPGRPRRQLLLHRDQLPDPGGAPGDGDAAPASTSWRPRSGSRRASRSASGRRTSRSAVTRSSSGSTPRTRPPTSGPRPGSWSRFHAPGGPGVRLDSHLYAGYDVPPYYDSLLGKLIVWGRDRPAAIARSKAALDELVVDGIITNRSLPPRAAGERRFRRGPGDHQPDRPRGCGRLPRAAGLRRPVHSCTHPPARRPSAGRHWPPHRSPA